jgi:hypothetical protein
MSDKEHFLYRLNYNDEGWVGEKVTYKGGGGGPRVVESRPITAHHMDCAKAVKECARIFGLPEDEIHCNFDTY